MPPGRLIAGPLAIVAITAIAPVTLLAQDEERARQVYEVFRNRCFSCHGEGRESGLDLRTGASLAAGGAHGPVLVPHQPEKSRLFLLVSRQQEPHMPRVGPKLSAADVDAIKQWN